MCGQEKVQLISPFVGRIYDWYKKQAGATWDEAANAGDNDPGVKSVRQIYNHYKHFGIATEVMGASFRNAGQITALAGCDLLTISPDLLAALAASEAPLVRALDANAARHMDLAPVNLDEAGFRYALNEDAMATEKLLNKERVALDGIAPEAKNSSETMPQAGEAGIGFLFGSERFGMANEDVYRCHVALSIPTNPGFGSLNLGAAIQVIAYEWRQALGGFAVQAAAPGVALADAAQVAGVTRSLPGAVPTIRSRPSCAAL